jgi:adenylosuccinate synthase
MKVDVLLGLQWGDEGKGKIVDFLAPHYDVIARFQGGPNAGHTLEFDGKKQILHTIPSGIFHKTKMNVIGNGVIIDPLVLEKEIGQLRDFGIEPSDNLLVSKKAHLILPTHLLLDAVYEKAKGDKKIGSTLKGIGPAYTDKTGRGGIRVGDISSSAFEARYAEIKKHHLIIAGLYCDDPHNILLHGMNLSEYEVQWMKSLDLFNALKKTDSEFFINDCLARGQKVLAEGAQGTLLDIDFGSYPFVTSSNTICGGVCAGLGISPSRVGEVYGVFKAYCTRVGSGPFPTELFDAHGEMLRREGNEFGSTTGRPRRCGWLDMPALQYAIMLNGVTQLLMMKADVLNGFDSISICKGYETPEGFSDRFTWDFPEEQIKPVYTGMLGWKQSLDACKQFSDLPPALMKYVDFIEKETGKQISVLSTGPDRKQTIIQPSFLKR